MKETQDGLGAHPLAVRVECYAGYRAEETPRQFYIGDRVIVVVSILDRWLSPDHRYLKLRGDDGGIYLLRHDVLSGRWELSLYDSRRLTATRLSST